MCRMRTVGSARPLYLSLSKNVVRQNALTEINFREIRAMKYWRYSGSNARVKRTFN